MILCKTYKQENLKYHLVYCGAVNTFVLIMYTSLLKVLNKLIRETYKNIHK